MSTGRTGTASFQKAMEILKFGPCYHMKEVIDHPGHARFWLRAFTGQPYDFDEIFQDYHSTCDCPSSLKWKEQLEKYPNAKVVLTIRDSQSWFKSCKSTIFRVSPTSPHSSLGIRIVATLGLPTKHFKPMLIAIWHSFLYNSKTQQDDWSEEFCIEKFNEHNARVRNECPADKLLVFEAKQGWEPLCKFLNVPIPDVPYPHENDTASFQRIIFAQEVIGYTVLSIGVAAIAGITHFLLNKWTG